MAVTTIAAEIKTPMKYPSAYPVPAGSLDVTEVAPSVAADGVDYVVTGKEIVFIHNTAASPATFTLVSNPAPPSNRTGDITAYALAAGAIVAISPPAEGWANPTSRKITITMSAATVKVFIVRTTNSM